MTDQDTEMLKDIFAGLAMCGYIINGDYSKEEIPHLAYAMANEMMETRNPIGIKTVRKGRTHVKTNANS